MRGKRFSEEQIIGVLKEAETGLPISDVLRKHGISQGTFYRWKAKFGGMEVSDARRLKGLEDENRRLKKLVADQALDIQILAARNALGGKARTSSVGSPKPSAGRNCQNPFHRRRFVDDPLARIHQKNAEDSTIRN